MRVTRVRFDGQTFLLDAEQDVDQTKAAIVAALRGGSDFVDFRTVGHGTISLLVAPGVPVRFEVLERSAEELERYEAEPLTLDSAWLAFDY